MAPEKKKILFVASVDRHILCFHLPFLRFFKERGWIVHVAARKIHEEDIPYCDRFIALPFSRSPFSINNISSFRKLKKLFDSEGYHIVHTHTPVASVLTRLAAKRKRVNGLKVIYTAHGFHFFKGAPLLNRLIYYPLEKYLSRHTDCLITINEEDYKAATEKGFKAGNIFKVNGMGVDCKKFSPLNSNKKLREELNIPAEAFILTYVAELSHRKNQEFIIDALPELILKIPELRVIFVGDGILEKDLKKKVEKKGLKSHVLFLGYRKDIPDLISVSDVGISASRFEGLPMNLLEFLASGKPIVASNCRGNSELVVEHETGFLFNDPKGFIEAIVKIYRKLSEGLIYQENTTIFARMFSLEMSYAQHIKIYDMYI